MTWCVLEWLCFALSTMSHKTSTVKCCYKLCGNSYKTVEGLKMFRFPKKNHHVWVVNCGNAELIGISPSKLYKNKKVCSKHFNEEDILPNGRLMEGAVPIPFKNEESSSNEDITVHRPNEISPKKYSRRKDALPESSPAVCSSSANFLVEMSPSVSKWVTNVSPIREGDRSRFIRAKKSLFNSPSNIKMSKKMNETKKELAKKRVTLSKLKKQILKSKLHATNLPISRFKSKDAAILCSMQMRKKGPWKKEEKRFSVALYLKSPSTYLYLRKSLVLPARSTISSWLSSTKMFNTGFNKELLSKLEIKASTMSDKEKSCVLMFDEMSIKKCLEYNPHLDLIEGFQNIGIFGRGPQVAKQASVFMIRGLYFQWKLPVGYFITENGLKGDQTKELLKQSVEELMKIGFLVKAVVCDQCTANTSAFKKLGVDEETPYWISSNGEKIFAMYDSPHLIKSLRNNLITHNFELDGEVIRFQDLRELYQIDSTSQTTRSAPQLTPAHIWPNNFQKMSVSLATQVFSHTTSAALKTASATGQLNSLTALNTAKFCGQINSLFDALNSKKKISSNPDNSALSKGNSHVTNILTDGIEMFKKLRKINALHPDPPCFQGIRMTVKSILQLFESEQCQFILTSRLNQDPLENLFSSIRQRGGFNRNPTVRVFRGTLRIFALKHIIEPPRTTSYDPDLDEVLDVQVMENRDHQANQVTVGGDSSTEDGSQQSAESSMEDVTSKSEGPVLSSKNIVSLEHCSQVYFAGYLVHVYNKRYKCSACLSVQSDEMSNLTSKKELLLLNRSFTNIKIDNLSGLIAPSESVLHVVSVVLQVYKAKFHKLAHKKHLIRRLEAVSRKVVSVDSITCSNCSDRGEFFFKFLLKVLIHKQCKWTNAKFTTTALDKIKVLKHV